MARVYLAESLASGVRKLVVLKVLNRELAHDVAMRAAFRREAELSAQMNHSNVVQVFEVVEHAGTPVIVMEYLDGVSLASILKEAQHELPLAIQLHIITQVLAGLHHFHELRDFDGNPLNAVHRDVSPQNVLVLYDGPVKVVDFGIAKIHDSEHHTRTGMIKGKLHYMPPEQLVGESSVDRRADVFAVGVMLWEAIAARRMWQGITEPALVRALACGELPRLRETVPDVPHILEGVVERATKAQREERYATTEQMQLDLEHALAAMGRSVHPREISNFMLKRFGDRRTFQRRAVERALRDPAATLSGVMECMTPVSLDVGTLGAASGAREAFHGNLAYAELPAAGAGAEHDIREFEGEFHLLSERPASASLGLAQSTTNTRVSARAPARPRKRRGLWPLVASLLVAAAIAGTFLVLERRNAARASLPAAADGSIVIEVSAVPANAQILLDGVELGQGRYRGSRAALDRDAVLEARAPGYVTERRNVRLSKDLSAELILSAESAIPANAASETQAVEPAHQAQGSPTEPASSPASMRRARAVPRPAKPSPAPAAQSAVPARSATASCNPPYRLTPDGVQVFKPECF